MTSPAPLTHKALTAHVRSRLAAEGIKARCSMQVVCGDRVISVVPPTVDARFSDAEQVTIGTIGQVNGLTMVRGLPIVPDQGTHGHGFRFHMA